jgi:hypothetical protein
MANVHPWFANVTVQIAAGWTAQFFNQTNVQPASLLSNNVSFVLPLPQYSLNKSL